MLTLPGRVLVELIGKSLAYPGTNAYVSHWGAETMIALAPPWADLIAADYPSIEDTQEALWRAASHPIEHGNNSSHSERNPIDVDRGCPSVICEVPCAWVVWCSEEHCRIPELDASVQYGNVELVQCGGEGVPCRGRGHVEWREGSTDFVCDHLTIPAR